MKNCTVILISKKHVKNSGVGRFGVLKEKILDIELLFKVISIDKVKVSETIYANNYSSSEYDQSISDFYNLCKNYTEQAIFSNVDLTTKKHITSGSKYCCLMTSKNVKFEGYANTK